MMAEHHPPMEGGQVEVASILAAAPPQETATIGGGDELSVMVAELDTKKRSAPEGQEEAPIKRRRKKPNAFPPKKLNNEQWDLMFERLVEYKRQHGDCLVPKRYAADPKLGTWVETQRIQWKKLPRTQAAEGEIVTPNRRLNDERLKRLQSIDFAWSAKNVKRGKLAASSPSSPVEGGKKALLSGDAAARAAARERENDKQWTEMYNRLVVYRNKHGDCLVPKKYPQDPKLASWVEAQRNSYNREYKQTKSKPDSGTGSNEDSPPPSTVAAMPRAKTPEEWAEDMDRDATAMEDGVEAAAMEVVNEVTAADDGGGKPAAVDYMAASPTNKRLTQERINMLNALGFVWSLRSKRTDDHWDDRFRQLVEYKEKHGDCLVPSRYEENPKLGKWVETQRYEYTKLQRATGQKVEPNEQAPVEEPLEEGKADTKSRSSNPRLTEERLRRLEGIGFEWKVKNKMKRYYDRQWDTMFEKLLKFKEENGHCLVPKRYPPDFKLGTWVHTQRIQYRKLLTGASKEASAEPVEADSMEDRSEEEEKNFRLTEDRRRRLDEVGFVWSAREVEKASIPAKNTRNSYDDHWDFMFERLKAYKERHGDCLVPKRCKEDPKLGTWVDTQRVQRKKLIKHLESQELQTAEATDAYVPSARVPGRLTADRMARLESIGFVWSLRDDWHKHFNELKAFKEEHGHCNVPARYAENRKLGIWVSAQRQQKKLLDSATGDTKPARSSPLTKERIALLDGIGFTWTIRSRDSLGESWNQRLEELRAYKRNHGNCLVPSRYPPNPELGVWVGTQRTQYRLYMKAKEAGQPTSSSAMNEERIALLEELGFVWALRGGSDTVWRKRISELIEYRDKYGDTAVPANYSENTKLANWAATQRAQYRLMQEGKPSSLDEEKVAELDSLQFRWDEPREDDNDDIVDSDAVASALAAAADIASGIAMEYDVVGGGYNEETEATEDDLLNVAI